MSDGPTESSRDAPVVSVVVPVHNGAATLAAQLTAIAEQDFPDAFEVVVVDNRSSDGSGDVTRGFADRLPGLVVLRAEEGASVAYARNAGTAAAHADRIVYCDADDVVRPGWLSAMVAGLAKDDIVGGPLDVTRINSAEAQAMTWHPAMTELATTMKYLPYATGANLGLRKPVWQRLGGFDESFVGGHEEVDFAWRAQFEGFTVGFVPDAVVDYKLRDDLRSVVRQRFAYGRTYAQLYARYRDRPIPRLSGRHEVRVIGTFLLTGPREIAAGRGALWSAGAAWTAGRWWGGLRTRTRPPL